MKVMYRSTVCYTAMRVFHLEAINYALNNFPLEDDFQKHARFLDFQHPKFSFQSVFWFIDYYSSHFKFTPEQVSERSSIFSCLTFFINYFFKEALTNATVRIGGDDEEDIIYCIDALRWYLYQMKIPGASSSNFHHLLKVAKLVLSVIHSNAVEGSLFLRV